MNKNTNEVTWLDLEDKLLNDTDQNSLPGNTNNYSRGQQTVDFVERVRDYYYLLLTDSCD
jgi:membrane-bound lytic murein transglycosylase MltF